MEIDCGLYFVGPEKLGKNLGVLRLAAQTFDVESLRVCPTSRTVSVLTHCDLGGEEVEAQILCTHLYSCM